jgi:lipoprotein-releasing system permease protein
MKLLLSIALKHLLSRKRQSLVSLLGIILGTGFFLAISSLMVGSEKDFLRRLVDNSPHITISDDFRSPRIQPAEKELAAIEIRSKPGIQASEMLVGQGLVTFAGKDTGVTLNGVIPEDLRLVSTIEQYLISGKVDDLITNPDGVLLGSELAKNLAIKKGDIFTVVGPSGTVRNLKVLGIFRTGRRSYDENQVFIHITRAQSLLDRVNRINSIIVKIPKPSEALSLSREIENRFMYKSISWQEASEDLLSTFKIRNTIMYTVVSAVLIVAAFGIYNVISTVVLEKQRDIAILKSIGFEPTDILKIFLLQGIILGVVGCALGLPFGMGLMGALMNIKFTPPGSTQVVGMPVDWGILQFLIAISFALGASILAAYLPARKAAKVNPVDIIRGGT